MAASLAGKTRLRPHQEEPQENIKLKAILKDGEVEWKALPPPMPGILQRRGILYREKETGASTPPAV
jgi:hypothetical protein